MKYNFNNQITNELENFQNHLKSKGFNKNTVRQNSNYTGIFLQWIEVENIEKQDVKYKEIIAFIHNLQREYESRFINRVLLAVRHYYEYLRLLSGAEASGVEANPANGIHLKGNKHKLPENIIEFKKLKELYENFEVNTNRDKRNRVILSLMIYQAITPEELQKLETRHIKLRQAKIYIPSGKHSNARTLEMQAVQLLDMQEYLQQTRPKMLEEIRKERSGRKPNIIKPEEIENQLFFSENGSENIKSSLYHLFRKIRKENPEITSTKIIRQSVIAHWLGEKNIRQVQYMAGHRYVSSTQRYRDYNMDELTKELKQYHPLDFGAINSTKL